MNQLTFWLFRKRNKKFLLKELKTAYELRNKEMSPLKFWQYSYELPCQHCIIAIYRDYSKWYRPYIPISSQIKGVNDSCANICKIIFGKIPDHIGCKYIHNKLLRRFGCRGMRI